MFMEYMKHRAKAFAGFAVSGVTAAILEAVEKTFDIQLGAETKATIIGAATSTAVYWISNGPKEGSVES